MNPYASIAVFVHVLPKMASIITLQLLPFAQTSSYHAPDSSLPSGALSQLT